MSDISSALHVPYMLSRGSRESRDPDGADPRNELDGDRLEPSSHSETINMSHMNSAVSNITTDSSIRSGRPKFNKEELSRLVGVPPPPPKNPPPRKNRRSKRDRQSVEHVVTITSTNSTIEIFNEPSTESIVTDSLAKDTIEILNDLAAEDAEDAITNDDSLPKESIEILNDLATENVANDLVEKENNEALNDVTLGETISQSFSGLQGMESPQSIASHDDSVESFMDRSQIIDIDDVSMISMGTELSRPAISGRENLPSDTDGDMIGNTMGETPALEEENTKPMKKQKKGGFFRKLFRGKGKDKPPTIPEEMIPTTETQDTNEASEPKETPQEPVLEELVVEEPSDDVELHNEEENFALDQDIVERSNSVEEIMEEPLSPREMSQTPDEVEQATSAISNDSLAVTKRMSEDPPDNDHGDPPENDPSLTVDVQPRNTSTFEPEGDPSGDVNKVLSTKAKYVPVVRTIDVDDFDDWFTPTPSNKANMRVLVPSESVDPNGAAPTEKDIPRGRSSDFEPTCQDPAGESPKTPWKVVVHDPAGDSPNHADDLKKSNDFMDNHPTETLRTESQDPPIEVEKLDVVSEDTNIGTDDDNEESTETGATNEANRAALDLLEPSSVVTSNQAMPPHEEDTDSVSSPSEEKSPEATSDEEQEEKQALTVSAAAFLNAQAVAYLHQLHGEPSPRHTWHVSKVKKNERMASTEPTRRLSTQEVKAKNAPKQESTVVPPRKKTPSPEDYSASNAENMTPEDPLKSKEISKFQGFAYRQKFKSRKPFKKSNETQSTAPAYEYDPEKLSLLTLDNLTYTKGQRFSLSINKAVANSNFPSSKIAAQAVAKNAILKCEKRLGLSLTIKSKKKPEGRNRFHFNRPESEIRNPMQRASRRLFSKSAVRIQSIARMYLAKCEAVDRMWALLAIQSYSRRWESEAILRGRVANKRNDSAIMIQKAVRGYLAAARVYDTMYCIVSIQALIRGANVRKMHSKYKEFLSANAHFAVPMQALFRGFKARKDLARSDFSACKIQSLWRSYSARINFQFEIVDIVVVQSVARRWLAYKKVTEIKNAPFFLPASKIQARCRGCLARSLVRRTLAERQFKKEEQAACAIQKAWRGFWSFSHFIIMQYEVTRIQAIVRGRQAKEEYHLKLGCAIMIQATVRQYLSRKKYQSKLVSDAQTASAVQELRERNAAKRIQFWWRIVLDWTKEKRAALVIERFFIHVRKEVEKEIQKQQWKASMKHRKKRRQSDSRLFSMGDCGSGLKSVDETRVVLYQDQGRSQSAPRARDDNPQRTAAIGAKSKRMASPQYKKTVSFDDGEGTQRWPVPDVNFAHSNVSEISQITTPECLLQKSQSYEKRPREKKLSADDYIKKYNSSSVTGQAKQEQKSQHFFSESRDAQPRAERVSSYGQSKVSTPGSKGRRTPKASSTPRSQSGTPRRVPRSPYHQKTIPASPRVSSSGSRTPRSHRSPRMSSSGSRTPRSHVPHSPRMSSSSSQRENDSYYSPVALPRQNKHVIIKRDNTIATESMSHSTHSADDGSLEHHGGLPRQNKYLTKTHSPVALPRQNKHVIIKRDNTIATESMSHSTHSADDDSLEHHGGYRSPVVMKNYQGFSPRQPRHSHEIYLGDEYGEV